MTTIPATVPHAPVGSDHVLDRLVLDHQLALVDLLAQVDGMRDRLRRTAHHDPVEHVSWRLKSWDSIVAKARRKGIALTDDELRAWMFDLAGVRFTCAFLSDLARVRDAVLALPGVTLVEERDYVTRPKPGGYRALHLIVRVSGTRGAGRHAPVVEIQLRTIAMDFWACLEHRLAYQHRRGRVPARVSALLKATAAVAASLDRLMERLRREASAGVAGTGAAPAAVVGQVAP